MERLQEFQSAARANGFIEVAESEEGSTLWFRNTNPDIGSAVHKRLCVDSLTNSVTIYWETLPTKLNSKTFRTVAAMEAWFSLKIGS